MDQQGIDNLTAEKIALDQSLGDQIRLSIELRKYIILKDKCITDMNAQIQTLMKELEDVKKSLEVTESSTT